MEAYDLRVLLHHSWSDDAFPHAGPDHANSLDRLLDKGFLVDGQLTANGMECIKVVCRAASRALEGEATIGASHVEMLLHAATEVAPFDIRTRSHRSAFERLHAMGLLDDDGITPAGKACADQAASVDFTPSFASGGP